MINKKYCIENGLIKAEQFELPERIVQFGTGVLLRGLCDYLIDSANKQGVFNGRAVVIKTTNSDASDFPNQDCVFTINIKGIENQSVVNKSVVNSALSRLMNASDEWSEILALAEKPEVDILISNTTEAGIKYVEEDIFQNPPASFPAKLTAFLYKKYEKLGENAEMVVIPTELLVGNGEILRGMVVQHAERHNLENGFLNWLKNSCRFCNSLVDRIVPGATPANEKTEKETELGYSDNLMINAEPFLLWAVEGDDFVKNKLSFALPNSGMVIAEDISRFREHKLRLLNGGHTISVPWAYLNGFRLVRDMMSDAQMGGFVEKVVKEEILQSMPAQWTDGAEAFANAVLDRFRNPFIEHKLISITVQCTAKMNARNAATFLRYHEKFGTLPPLMTAGFAAYLLFTRPVKQEGTAFYGQLTEGGDFYPIQDDHAAFFKQTWDKTDELDLSSLCDFVEEVLSNEVIFDKKLKELPDFIGTVAELIFDMTNNGFKKVIEKYSDAKVAS
jgi:tagaturonate reductase